MKRTIRVALFLVFFLVMLAPVFAGSINDSLYNKVSNAVLHKIALRQQENEALRKKGLPGNYMIYVTDADVAPQDTFPQHLLPLLQQNTKQSDVEKLWDFAGNEYLKPVAQKIQSFSAEQGFDYYVVVCAIYNYFSLDENTDFSNITWTNSNLLKSNDPVASKKTGQGDTNNAGYHKLFDYLTNKFENDPRYKRGNKPTVYHFVMSTYVPDYNATDSRPVGLLRHFQGLYWSMPNDVGFENAKAVFLHNRQAELAGSNNNKNKAATKEEWLLASVSATQDFIATVRNFKESDLMAKNFLNMLQYLKNLKQPELILSSISFVTRAHIINALNSFDLTDDYLIKYGPEDAYGGENAMLAVIRTTPPGQADSLKDLLSDNEYKLLKDLDRKFDDAGLPLTNNNYTRFVEALTNVLASGVSSDELAEIVKKGRIYRLTTASGRHELENPFIGDIKEQFDNHLRDSLIGSFYREYSSVVVYPDDMTLYKVLSFTETWSYQSLADSYYKQAQDASYVVKPVSQDKSPTNKEFLDPFDMILVIPQEDFTVNGFHLGKNSFRLIPMYYYYWLKRKHENETLMEIAEDVGNPLLVASMATGIGEIVKGGELATQAIRGARVLFEAKLLLNSLGKGSVDDSLKKMMGAAGFSAYKLIEFVYLGYTMTKGGIILAYKVGEVFSSALVTVCKAITKSPVLLAELEKNASVYAAFKTYFKSVMGRDLAEAIAEAGKGMPPPAESSSLPFSLKKFEQYIQRSYPKLYDDYTQFSNTLKEKFASQYYNYKERKYDRRALDEFDKSADEVDEWVNWMTSEKTPVNSWKEAQQLIDKLLEGPMKEIKELYPNAKVGYRGSLTNGVKHTEPGKPVKYFDPKDFDCDAFIVDDALARECPVYDKTWRNARDGDPDLEAIANKLDKAFLKISGYRFEPGRPFTFRVWTMSEYLKEVKPKGCKLF